MTRHKWVWTVRWVAILVLMLAGNGAIVWAQRPALPASAVVSTAAEPAPADTVQLLVGRSAVLDVASNITRVSLTSAEIADVLVTSPSQLLINGKMPGTISMFVWDRGTTPKRYEVVVQRDLEKLTTQINELFPGQQIEVKSNGKNIVLSGYVSNKDVIEKVVNVAAGYVDKKEEVTTLLQLRPDGASNQVLLRVRFAEVSRSAMTELGASYFTSPLGVKNTLGRLSTQQYAAPGFDKLEWTKESSDFGAPVTSAKGEFTFSDFLNLFVLSEKYDLGMMVKALQNRGLFQSLAEPNLVAESGKEASFLAGGEFPIPIVQGGGATMSVSVQFKEFGVRLNFTPTVNGDRVHLKVKPEVSTLDFNNAVVLNGFRIPALTTRRTETELELGNGQTFAISGLMNNQVLSSMQKVPGIGDIPILGLLFRSKAAQKSQTELVVMITPEILPNNSRGVTPNLPRMQEPYLPPMPERRTLPQPPPPFGATQVGPLPQVAQTGTPGAPATTSMPGSSPASAAASVSALTPAGPRIGEPGAAAVPTRPMTEEERRVFEREQKRAEEQARLEAQAYARAQAVEGRRIAEERAKAEKAGKEQAKRDAELARKAQEAAKKQAERDREQQKAVAEAAARLKAAEAAYNAEVAKKNNP
jgi:pilus assembly protein CpaC